MNNTMIYQPDSVEEMIEQLNDLKKFNDGNQAVISCYLDTQSGKQHCEDYIDEKLSQIMQSCTRADQHALSGLSQTFQSIVQQVWKPQVKGLCIFCSNLDTSPSFKAYLLRQSVGEHFMLYSKASILPMQRLLDDTANASVLTFIDDVIQIYNLSLGNIKPMAWAMAPQLSNRTYTSQSYDKKSFSHRHIQRVCLTLLKSQNKPLVIAANPDNLEKIKDWLPRKICWNITDTIALPYELGHSGFIDYLQDYQQQQMRLKHDYDGSNLLNSIRSNGAAVAGPVATLNALRERKVERLIISPHHTSSRNMQCLHCEHLNLHAHNMRCSNCAQSMQEAWNPQIEASWLAFHQQIPVTRVDSEELQFMGGMGCFLKQDRKVEIQPLPAKVQVGRFERVA